MKSSENDSQDLLSEGAGAVDAAGLEYIETLYQLYKQDPTSVPADWAGVFAQEDGSSYQSPQEVEQGITKRARWPEVSWAEQVETISASAADAAWVSKQAAVLRLIHAYRILGHVQANTDPMSLRRAPGVPDLDPATLGLHEGDMDTEFHTGNLAAPDYMPLREILEMLRESYTDTVGCEFMFIHDAEQKNWLQRRIESSRTREVLTPDEKRQLLASLTAAEGLERYLHIKFSGKKRFSLEGGETLIPLIREMIQRAGASGVKEIVLGMAHRGRLNVLTNIMGKAPSVLFSEFGDHVAGMDDQMIGDVKYHAGFSSDVQTPGGLVHLALAFNPSHLEIINPVITGSARARQDRNQDFDDRSSVLPLLIHGDAALAGQGVGYETLQLSQTRGYGTGGAVHVVINNQVGFTTSHPLDARSSLYCTDVGKVCGCPIFHVNSDDPEAVMWAIRTAVDFRMKFKKDVFIDLVCYRRHGHNEGDEPSVTQPKMYRIIRKHASTPTLYAEDLLEEGVIDTTTHKSMQQSYRDALDEGSQVAPNIVQREQHTKYYTAWQPYLHGNWRDNADTGVKRDSLQDAGLRACQVPSDFTLHPGVRKLMQDRTAMINGEMPLDWGCAETLAYATLLDEGFRVRISGQDSGRGTFFHRHAVLHDYANGKRTVPLKSLREGRQRFQVYDSILSEEAVMGFEYGYSMTDPQTLVIWEAQYGDFANGAQVVVDQFVSSSQQKWNLFSGLTLMLPHGWEGQGPEHSSARLERYLQLCAQANMQVVVPSTAGQMFHLLRRQMKRKLRIPLIIMSPKSMLRRKESFSTLEDLESGEFQNIIGEVDPAIHPDDVTRVVLCSGKVYYELVNKRHERDLKHVAVIRIEQLYPFEQDTLTELLKGYGNLRDVVWCQEEPINQGAWYQIQHRLHRCVRPHQTLSFAGRVACSAPAGGSPLRHNQRELLLLHSALDLETPEF